MARVRYNIKKKLPAAANNVVATFVKIIIFICIGYVNSSKNGSARFGQGIRYASNTSSSPCRNNNRRFVHTDEK